MKKSANITLTVVAAVGIAAHAAPRPDPCAAANFNEQACRAAIQDRGYCWNGRWVGMKYHYPFPFYYDAYQEYVDLGGLVSPAAVGSCTQRAATRSHFVSGSHTAARAGFGSSGACHSAHS